MLSNEEHVRLFVLINETVKEVALKVMKILELENAMAYGYEEMRVGFCSNLFRSIMSEIEHLKFDTERFTIDHLEKNKRKKDCE
ncbi:hypothetical protein GCM10023116_29700 [Kistimonas scapharcae]|uniref:Uncharacterized protein n=1 Tax=Kistimonas scapharcae TaxID=1036133 RepID=A0ABP8V6W3_9GAMM